MSPAFVNSTFSVLLFQIKISFFSPVFTPKGMPLDLVSDSIDENHRTKLVVALTALQTAYIM